ncbi:MAG TPA: SDR family oxidoreductase, partial [Candidatus Megaira endosymbiont of Hartmannula sinica]|nr:SDR family oxidoreductase [Candidatus Megaera endosymbiont of Hartmannula sinica]
AGARKVIMVARDKNKLDKSLKYISDVLVNGGYIIEDNISDRILTIIGDISDISAVKNIFYQLEKQNEKVDICINNAGIATITNVFDIDENNNFNSEKVNNINNNDINFINQINTNLIGTWFVIRNCARHMRSHNIAGSIINITSINGSNKPSKNMAGYCASKAGVIQITRSIVKELAEYNIRINNIDPGFHKTPMVSFAASNPIIKKELEQIIPLGFIPDPKELIGSILMLSCNSASRNITGSTITIDGGLSWRGEY